MPLRHVLLAAALAATFAGGAGASEGPTPLAVTIDDLPWAGPAFPGRVEATDRLLASLGERGVPAAGFVITDRIVPAEPILARWIAAGMEIGSHSAAHRDLNEADLGVWLADVRRAGEALRAALGRPVRFFRYPYLHQGPTAERRDRAAALLSSLGYAVAHVTIDNSDWRLARWYAAALEGGDAARRDAVARAYVDHVLGAARHFREVSRRKVGRDVSHVLLLHANQLAADRIGVLLDALREEGFRFVTLQEALRDPVYALRDDYLGPWGCSWLDRIAPADREPTWIDEEDRRLRALFEAPPAGAGGAP